MIKESFASEQDSQNALLFEAQVKQFAAQGLHIPSSKAKAFEMQSLQLSGV
jgi:hypothetical protein